MLESSVLNHLQEWLSYPFKDPDFKKKLLTGSAIAFVSFIIPIIPAIFLMGYSADIMRRVNEDGQPVLPEWSDGSRLAKDGLRVFGVSFIYMLPVSTAMVLAYGLMFGASFASIYAAQAWDLPEELVGFLPMLGSFSGLIFFAIAMLIALAIGVVLPPAMAHTAIEGKFSAGFRFGEFWRIFRANLGAFLVSYILVIGLYMLLTFAVEILYMSIVCCCLIPFVFAPIMYYMMVVVAYFIGLSYRDGRRKANEISPAGEITPA